MKCLEDERADSGVTLCSFVLAAESGIPARLQALTVTVHANCSKHGLIDKNSPYIQPQPIANDRK